VLDINSDGNIQFEVLIVIDRDNYLGIPVGKKIVVESQPIGRSANRFRRETSKLIGSGNYLLKIVI
jgi:hypothetical protein